MIDLIHVLSKEIKIGVKLNLFSAVNGSTVSNIYRRSNELFRFGFVVDSKLVF